MTGPGKVWLVGAGPGDAGLLTLRGREALEGADTIVYDRLVGPGVAAFFPPNAETVYVGKRVGNHTVRQEEIEDILLREASAGKKVVRLKGGDPFLFGRGGEEAIALMEAGIDVEVVPGVTSAVSVPACAGIPVTHRDLSGGVHIVTAHRTNEEDELDYAGLAASGDTLVILMGAGRLSEIARRLIEAGRDADTPAAVIQDGTTARMRRVSGTLAGIAELAARRQIDAPAVIVIGAVAGLRLDWRKNLPLAGARVWLTETKQPADGRAALAQLAQNAGAEVVHIPCIATEATDTPLPAAEELAKTDWLIFSSQTGVVRFFEALRRERRDIRSLGTAKIAAVGPSTASAIEERGLVVDFIPDIHDGDHLAKGLIERGVGARVAVFRCRGEQPAWAGLLRDAGAGVSLTGLYRTVPTPSPMLENIADGDVIVFKSASAVEVCADRLTCEKSKIRAICIGAPTAAAAKAAGFSVTTAPRASDEAIFALLEHEVRGALPRTPQGTSGPLTLFF